jgi:hypothetical protein
MSARCPTCWRSCVGQKVVVQHSDQTAPVCIGISRCSQFGSTFLSFQFFPRPSKRLHLSPVPPLVHSLPLQWLAELFSIQNTTFRDGHGAPIPTAWSTGCRLFLNHGNGGLCQCSPPTTPTATATDSLTGSLTLFIHKTDYDISTTAGWVPVLPLVRIPQISTWSKQKTPPVSCCITVENMQHAKSGEFGFQRACAKPACKTCMRHHAFSALEHH